MLANVVEDEVNDKDRSDIICIDIVDTYDIVGNSPIIQTIKNGRIEDLDDILRNGADIDMKDENGLTALMHATILGKVAILKYLLAAKANPNIRDTYDRTVLMHSCIYGHAECTQVIVQHFLQNESLLTPYKSNLNKLTGYIFKKDRNEQIMYENEHAFNTRDSHGMNALMHASNRGYVECIRVLCQSAKGIEVNLRRMIHSCRRTLADDSTALMQACYKGHTDCASLLIQYGGNIKMTNNRGMTCLMIACRYGNTHCVQYLLQQNTDIRSVDNLQKNALMHASANGHIECMQLLLAYRKNSFSIMRLSMINTTSLKPLSDLRLSSTTNTSGNKSQIISDNQKATSSTAHMSPSSAVTQQDKDISDTSSLLPLHNKSLLAIDIDAVDRVGLTALMHSLQNNHIQCVELLLLYQANIHISDINNEQALHYACSHCMQGVPLLLQHGANIYSYNKSRWTTPLMRASMLGDAHSVRVLLDHHHHRHHLLVNTSLNNTHNTDTSTNTNSTTAASSSSSISISTISNAPITSNSNNHESTSSTTTMSNTIPFLADSTVIPPSAFTLSTPTTTATTNNILNTIPTRRSDSSLVVKKYSFYKSIVSSSNTSTTTNTTTTTTTTTIVSDHTQDNNKTQNQNIQSSPVIPRYSSASHISLMKTMSSFSIMNTSYNQTTSTTSTSSIIRNPPTYNELMNQYIDIQDKSEMNALLLACKFKHDKCVHLLLEAQASVTYMTNDHQSVLDLVCEDNTGRTLKTLISHHPSYVNYIDPNTGLSTLMKVCIKGYVECIRVLCEAGVDIDYIMTLPSLISISTNKGQIDCTKYKGNTALMIACQEYQVECVRILLQYDADISIQNDDGYTAADLLSHLLSTTTTSNSTTLHHTSHTAIADHTTLGNRSLIIQEILELLHSNMNKECILK